MAATGCCSLQIALHRSVVAVAEEQDDFETTDAARGWGIKILYLLTLTLEKTI